MTDYKIILYGEYGVGKTCLTTRLLRGTFNDASQSTIGASFMSWKPELVSSGEKTLTSFGIWDTAGQERFSSLLPMYLRNADAVFCCWDHNLSFDPDAATNMYNKAKGHSPDCHFYLVLTKIDQEHTFHKSPAVETWAKNHNIQGIFYTSSVTGQGVQELFTTMAKNLLARPKKPVIETLEVKSRGSGCGC